MGTRLYSTAFAQAEIINKYSSWLRVSATESAGSAKHLTDLTNKPELRKNTMHLSPTPQIPLAEKGLAPFDKPYTGTRAVMPSTDTALGWITYDNKIKTWQDLKGKKFMNLPKTTNGGVALDTVLTGVWKLQDISVSYGFYDAMARALRDGVVDAVFGSIEGMPDTGWELTPQYAQLQAEKPGFHFIGISSDDVAKVSQLTGQQFHPLAFPKGTKVGLTLPEDLSLLGNMLTYYADESMDADVVNEFVRITYEHIDEIKARYAGSYLSKKNLGMVDVPEDKFHPGALKFYKENRLPIGLTFK